MNKNRNKGFLARFPLVSFFILAYLGSWIVWGLFILSKDGSGLLPFNSPMSFLMTVSLGIFTGPFLAAFIITAVTEGYAGISRLLHKIILWQVDLQWYLFALIGLPIIMLISALVLPEVKASFTPINFLGTLLSYLPFFIYPALLIGGPLGEEPGWRGFALPRLQKLYGPLIASLILGVLWGFWHMPIWFSRQWTKPTVFNITLYVTWITAITVIMTWVFNHTKESVLIAILIHASFDAFPNAILWQFFPALTKLTDSGFLYGYVGLVIGFGTTALALIILTRGRLGYQDPPSQV